MIRWLRAPHRLPYVLGAIYFTVMTVVMTWPLPTRLAEATVGRPGDNLYFIWVIGWVQKAIFSLHQSPFFTDLINHPEGWALASTEMTPLMVALALPFSLAGGPALGYNVASLVSFAATGILLFVWVFRLTGSLWGALIGGTILAFFPYRLSHFLAGHLNLLATPALVAAFLGLDLALHSERRAARWAIAGGAGLGLVALSSMYYIYMSLVMLVVYLTLDLILSRRERPAWRNRLSCLSIYGVSALPFLLAGLLPYVTAAGSDLVPVRGIEAAVSYSGSPSDYLLPFTGHPLWGPWIGDHFNRAGWIEATLYPGFVASILALLGWALPRRSSPITKGRAWTYGLTSAVAFVLSLGVTLHWAGWPVSLQLPASLEWLQADDGQSILMPGSLLYRVLPYYGSVRVPMRYAIFVELFLSVLAGCGAAWAVSRAKRWAAHFVGALLLVMVLVDFLPPRWDLMPVEGRPVDLWLREQPSDGAVAQFPLIMADEQFLLYATLIHEKPYIGVLYPTPQFRAVKPTLDSFPSPESIARLHDLGVRYIIVDKKWYDEMDALDDLVLALEDQGLTLAVDLDGQQVYLLDG